MKKGSFLLFVFAVVFFMGCDSSIINEAKEIPNGIWTYDNGLNFEFVVSDTTKHYDLVLEINHTTDYPFQNIYLKIITTYPSEKKVDDILSIDLADKSGKWFGDCNSTDCKTTVNLMKNTLFRDDGKHSITFFQNTRTENVAGITGLRFIIKEVKQ